MGTAGLLHLRGGVSDSLGGLNVAVGDIGRKGQQTPDDKIGSRAVDQVWRYGPRRNDLADTDRRTVGSRVKEGSTVDYSWVGGWRREGYIKENIPGGVARGDTVDNRSLPV